jgi:hypothetical protein
MKADSVGRGLQMLANVAVIAASGCVIWWIATQRTPPADRGPSTSYAVGESVGTVAGVDFRDARETLLMVLREDCRYCRDSMTFYQQLSSAQRDTRGIRLVVVSTDAQGSMSAYLRSNAVQVDRVVTVAPGALKVSGTPCLLLVDSAGKVKKVWRGKLGATQEREVLAALGLIAPA